MTSGDQHDDDAVVIGESSSVAAATTRRIATAWDESIISVRGLVGVDWLWIGVTLLAGAALMVLANITTDIADGWVEGEHGEAWTSAIGHGLAAALILAGLIAVGWTHEAGVSSDYQRRGLRPSALIVAACLIPALALIGSSWEPVERIGSVAADVAANGLFDEFAFRGLLMVFIARKLADHEHGLLIAAVVVALTFGIVHLSPAMLLLGPLFSLAFTRLVLDTNSIWPAVVLHALVDWFFEFPFLADGTAEGSGWRVWSVLLVIAAAAVAIRRLAVERAAWQSLMSPNIVPVPR